MRGAIFLEKVARTFNRGMGMVLIVAGAEDKVGDALWVLAVYTSFRVNRRGQSRFVTGLLLLAITCMKNVTMGKARDKRSTDIFVA